MFWGAFWPTPVRALAATHGDLAKRLGELEEATEALAMSQDTLNRNTRAQFNQVFDGRAASHASAAAQATYRVHQPRRQGQEDIGLSQGFKLKT